MWKTIEIEVPDFISQIGNRKLEVYQENNPSNPREDEENLGKMYIWNKEYSLGDEKYYSSYEDLIDDLDFENVELLYTLRVNDYRTELIISSYSNLTELVERYVNEKNEEIKEEIKNKNPAGVYVVYKSDAKEWFNENLYESIKEQMQEEIKRYNSYVNGRVYYYLLYENEELKDSCGGIYADNERELKEELKNCLGDEYKDLINKLEYNE